MLHDSHLSKTGAEIESVRNDKIFYVLNPDNNLTKTQVNHFCNYTALTDCFIIFKFTFKERLEPEFRKMSLKSGVVGEQPSLEQVK